MSTTLHDLDWKLLSSAVVGAAAFPSFLGFLQHAVFKPLRLSSNLKYTSSILGCASVTLASFGASWAAFRVIYLLRDKNRTKQSLTEPELLLSTVGSVIIFRALGGKFNSMLPSNLMFPGAFAVEWVPALKESEFATSGERVVLNSMGQKHGCHSCGKRKWTHFVGDHQPPSKILSNFPSQAISESSNMPLQRFYPQCSKCSNLQGGLLTRENGKQHRKAYVTHASSLRVRHAFFPLPLALFYTKEYISHQNKEQAMVSVVSADQSEKPVRSKEMYEHKKEMYEHKEKKYEHKEKKVVERKKARKLVGLLDSDLLSGFPPLIIWKKVVGFLESFSNRLDAFHLTLWTFSIIAALGTM